MIDVITPSRLHFGLFAFDPAQPRQFGGIGLMVRQPNTRIRLSESNTITAEGRMADRAQAFAESFVDWAVANEHIASSRGVHIKVASIPRPHTGLGSGTQLGIAVATGLAKLFELDALTIDSRAVAVKRGKRSAIGAHGFDHGGLIMEAGKSDLTTLSPMVGRWSFPADWRIVLIRPKSMDGLSGEREQLAFDSKLSIPEDVTKQLCQITMLGIIPGTVEQDINLFGEALFELQTKVGDCFANAQGGRWAAPLLGDIIDYIRANNTPGVGQSSWGPTIYAICKDNDHAESLATRVQAQFNLDHDEVRITEADNTGAVVRNVQQSADKLQ